MVATSRKRVDGTIALRDDQILKLVDRLEVGVVNKSI